MGGPWAHGSVQCEICVQSTCHLKPGHWEGRKEAGPLQKPGGTLPSSGSTIPYPLERTPGGNNADKLQQDPVPINHVSNAKVA